MINHRDDLPFGQTFIHNTLSKANYEITTQGLCNGLGNTAIPFIILRQYYNSHPAAFGPMLSFLNKIHKEDFAKTAIKLNQIQIERRYIIKQAKIEALKELNLSEESQLTRAQETQFRKLKRNIIDLSIKSLTSTEQQLFYLPHFSGAIKILQQAKLTLFTQDDNLILPLVLPNEINSVGGLISQETILDEKKEINLREKKIIGAYNDNELEKYFKILASHLRRIKFEHPVAIKLKKIGHTITVGYDSTQADGRWLFVDPNNLSVSSLAQKNIHKGVRIGFEYLEFKEKDIERNQDYQQFLTSKVSKPLPVIMSATIYAAGQDKDALKQLIKNLNDDPEWIEINTVFNQLKGIDKTQLLDNRDNSLLMLAAKHNDITKLNDILDQGGNIIHQINVDWYTALDLANIFNSDLFVKELLKRSTNLTSGDLYTAAKWGNLALAEYINSNLYKDSELETALTTAAQFNQCECIKLLVAKGVKKDNYSYSPKEKITPLMIAAKNGHAEAVSLLLQTDSNQGIMSSDHTLISSTGKTALDFAVENNHVAVIKIFINYGITSDKIVKTAIQNDYSDMLALVLRSDDYNFDHIEEAIKFGSLHCIKLLLQSYPQEYLIDDLLYLAKTENLIIQNTQLNQHQIDNLITLLIMNAREKDKMNGLLSMGFNINELINANPTVTCLISEYYNLILKSNMYLALDWEKCKEKLLACANEGEFFSIVNPLYLEVNELEIISKLKIMEFFQHATEIKTYLNKFPVQLRYIAREEIKQSSDINDVINAERNILNSMKKHNLTEKHINFIQEICTKYVIPKTWQNIIIDRAEKFLYLIESGCIKPEHFSNYNHHLSPIHLDNLKSLLNNDDLNSDQDALKKLLECDFEFKELLLIENDSMVDAILNTADVIYEIMIKLSPRKRSTLIPLIYNCKTESEITDLLVIDDIFDNQNIIPSISMSTSSDILFSKKPANDTVSKHLSNEEELKFKNMID